MRRELPIISSAWPILVGHAAADERFCDRLLDQLVKGVAAPGTKRRAS
jgi:hypothetical protein